MENCKKIVKLILPAVRLAVTRKAEESGIVQTKIAKYLGIAQAEVSKYANNNVSGSIRELADKLANRKEIEEIVEDIMRNEEEGKVSQKIDEFCAEIARSSQL